MCLYAGSLREMSILSLINGEGWIVIRKGLEKTSMAQLLGGKILISLTYFEGHSRILRTFGSGRL